MAIWPKPGGNIAIDLNFFYDNSGIVKLLDIMKDVEYVDMYCEHEINDAIELDLIHFIDVVGEVHQPTVKKTYN